MASLQDGPLGDVSQAHRIALKLTLTTIGATRASWSYRDWQDSALEHPGPQPPFSKSLVELEGKRAQTSNGIAMSTGDTPVKRANLPFPACHMRH
ncbi:hypothetical protein C8Q74DRAFT_1279772 [Fomes fomentarius]|nr:hypothetical protein C8Q74DRAFT_1279772 [Fomes fomentarius]